jgi:hypothetical protein
MAVVADTNVFDGMKAFYLDYAAALRPLGVHTTFLDTTCAFSDADTEMSPLPADEVRLTPR